MEFPCLKRLMNFKKFLHSATAALVAVAAIAGSTASVFAAGEHSYTAINGSAVKVYHYVTLDSDANVPAMSIGGTVAAGAAQNATSTNAKVFAGINPSAVTVTPASFTVGQQKYTSVQDMASDTGTRVASGTKDPVTLDTGKSYARSAMTVDFSAVEFTEPGIYRYVITDQSTPISGITYDSTTTRVLDVYVLDDGDGALEIGGYVLHKSASDAVVPADGTSPATKAQGYVHSLEMNELTLSKAVTGNMASRDEFFEFTVNLSNLGAGSIVSLTGNYSQTTTTNLINTTTHQNPTTLTADANGSASTTIWLQNGQNIVFNNLVPGATYTISENKTTIDNEGYTPTATINGSAASFATGTYQVSGNMAANASVAYTNAKAGIVPTGIITSVLPGAMIIGVACIGFAMMKRRKDEA